MADEDEKSSRAWQDIAREAGQETDSQRLIELSEELDEALMNRDKRLQSSSPHPPLQNDKSTDSKLMPSPDKHTGEEGRQSPQ